MCNYTTVLTPCVLEWDNDTCFEEASASALSIVVVLKLYCDT